MSTNERSVSRRDLFRPLADGIIPKPDPADYRQPSFFNPEGRDEPAGNGASTGPSRREFVKIVGVAAATAAGARTPADAQTAGRTEVIAAIGDTLIPSDPGDPGYKDLEAHRITEEVMKALPGVADEDATLWNDTAKAKFQGKAFLELGRAEREQYVQQVLDGTAAGDEKTTATLRRVFRNTRRRVLNLYYANFPEHQWPRDRNGRPILEPGDTHQITNPNTQALVTGWDQCGFWGPLTWEEEERRRAEMKQVHWHEGWSPFDYQPEKVKSERKRP